MTSSKKITRLFQCAQLLRNYRLNGAAAAFSQSNEPEALENAELRKRQYEDLDYGKSDQLEFFREVIKAKHSADLKRSENLASTLIQLDTKSNPSGHQNNKNDDDDKSFGLNLENKQKAEQLRDYAKILQKNPPESVSLIQNTQNTDQNKTIDSAGEEKKIPKNLTKKKKFKPLSNSSWSSNSSLSSSSSLSETPSSNNVQLAETDDENDDAKSMAVSPNPMLKYHEKESFNLSHFEKSNKTLRRLVDLGVSLHKVERDQKGGSNLLMQLDWHDDVQPMIDALIQRNFTINQITKIFTEFPRIFRTSLSDVDAVLSYFQEKQCFVNEQTGGMHTELLSCCPAVLGQSVVRIDRLLGTIQKHFYLSNENIREMLLAQPDLLANASLANQTKALSVTLRRMMGFNEKELTMMIVQCPRLLLTPIQIISENFIFLHRDLKLEYEDIAKMWPACLTAKPHRDFRARTLFLKTFNLLQTDPCQPLFTPLNQFHDKSVLDNLAFVKKFAPNLSFKDYFLFMKTL